MNFGEIKQLVWNWLDDPFSGYFTDSDVSRWINNAQYETQKLLLQANENYYVKCVQTIMAINQQDYVLPNDFMKLHRLEVIISGTPPNEALTPLAPITLNQQDLVPGGAGQPQFYFIKKNRLVLWPAPDSELSLRLFYSPRVVEMADDLEIPDVPEHYHEFLAVLATIDGLLKDQRDPSPMLAKREYYQKMLDRDADERNQDAPRAVTETSNSGVAYGYGYW